MLPSVPRVTPSLRRRASPFAALVFIFAVVAAGCTTEYPSTAKSALDSGAARQAEGSRLGSSTRPRIVALGDSLTAGLGLPADEAYPAVLQRMMEEAGYGYEVVNAGVSGDTSSAGLRRLEWALEGDVRILVLALGANDGFRGISVPTIKANLAAMIERAKQRGAKVLLAGMEAPPNFGGQYTGEFRNAFRDLARQHRVEFLPFLLDGVAGVSSLNQGDGIHPNRDGARLVAEHVWRALEPMLQGERAAR